MSEERNNVSPEKTEQELNELAFAEGGESA